MTEGILPACVIDQAGSGYSKDDVDAMLEGVCTRFVFGKCRRGARCRYSHDVDRAAIQVAAGVPEAPPLPPTRSMASSAAATAAVGLQEETGDVLATAETEGDSKAVGARAWRSVDWLLKGESVRKMAYLQEFAAAAWLPELLDSTECSSLMNMRGKSLRKEITESFGALHACHRALAKLGFESDDAATVVDLCCGKGLLSLVLAKTMPKAHVVAVDTNPNMDLGHFRTQPNLSFMALDITSANAGARLSSCAAENAMNAALPDAPLVIVGVHLCGNLSDHALRLFKEAPGPVALVLIPCCLDGRQPIVKRRAKKLCVDPHRYWCLSLLMALPASKHEQRELFVDDDVISEKNSILIATRKAHSSL